MNQEHVSLIQSFNDEFNPFGKDWVKLYPDLTLVDIEFRLFEMYKYDEENKQDVYIPAWGVMVTWHEDYNITPIYEQEYVPDTFISDFNQAVSEALSMVSPYIYRLHESASEAVEELKRIEKERNGKDKNEDDEGNGENI